MQPTGMKRAAVIGAGLSGLTAAYRLQERGWQVTIYEASGLVGGRVQTVERDGYRIDTGASAIADSYKSYIKLAGELGLGAEIVPASPCIGIFRDGHLHELNLDRPLSLPVTGLLSPGAKLKFLRLAWDTAMARFRGQLDYADMCRAAPLDTESAGTYARRVLGKELTDYFVSPLVRLLLIADPDKISKVELFSGVGNIISAGISALRGGQGRLPRLLAERLAPKLNHPVDRVTEMADGVDVAFRDSDGVERAERFDACIVCCPLPDAARICADKSHLFAPLRDGLAYTQCITVALAFHRAPRARAFLVQMPTCEDADIALMFLDHNKAQDRAPSGRGLVDCHWETGAAEHWMDRSDDEIIAHSLESVYRVFPELTGQLAFGHVTKWRRALPQTAVGAYRLIGNFNAALDPKSRVQFASDYMSAAGQNTAVELGTRAAGTIDSNH